jgi:hypothetical protein
MPDTRIIAEIEAAGYGWIGAECCKGTVRVPFRLIRAGHPHWPLSTMTLDQVGQKLRCDRCRGRPRRYYPTRQEDAPGYARTF